MMLFVFTLILIAALGYLAQTTGLCMVRGVQEATLGKPLFLLAIVFSGSFAWVSILIAHLIDLPLPFVRYETSLLALLGGLLFGLGAAFNGGCGISTISKLARGQVAMLATVVGWIVGWGLLLAISPFTEPEQLYISSRWQFGFLFIVSIVILFYVVRMNRDDRNLWLSLLAIGLMASIVFLFSNKWTPSSLLRDMSYSLWSAEGERWPSDQRFMLIVAMVAGMLAAALWTKSFRVELANWRVLSGHLVSGVLMGVGAAIANGGNDSQLLLALPALSPAALVTVLSMLVGIFLGRKLV